MSAIKIIFPPRSLEIVATLSRGPSDDHQTKYHDSVYKICGDANFIDSGLIFLNY